MILRSVARTAGQIGDPRFRRVLRLGVLLAVALLAAVYALAFAALQALVGETMVLPWVGEVRWVGDLLTFGSVLVMLAASVVLMVPVASAITSLFLDDVAQAVEDRHHPGLGPPRTAGWVAGLADSARFLGLIVAANAVGLLVILALPVFAPLVFYGVNGLLLGLEYFQLAAARRVGRAQARALSRRHLPRIWAAGVLMALPLTVPLVNLAVPVLGAATFTHLFHAIAGTPAPMAPGRRAR
ncbi:MAG: EI24 domain-containing protein [Paracoccaceae bacterium]